MCWLMCMPNGLLSFRILSGTFKSDNYVQLLSEMIVFMIVSVYWIVNSIYVVLILFLKILNCKILKIL